MTSAGAEYAEREVDDLVETNWSIAGTIAGDPDWAGGTVFRDVHQIPIPATQPAQLEVCDADYETE